LKKHDVHVVVRVCEPTYSTEELQKNGISVIDLAYDDGTSPPNEVNIEMKVKSLSLKKN